MKLLDQVVVALSGLGLGVALVLGRLTEPRVIVGWIDWFGAWDPTLIVFFVGAVLVYHGAYRWALARERRGATPALCFPTRQRVDARLLGGAAVFGVGWALGGTCPGPALSALGAGAPWALVFVAAMLGGLLLGERLAR